MEISIVNSVEHHSDIPVYIYKCELKYVFCHIGCQEQCTYSVPYWNDFGTLTMFYVWYCNNCFASFSHFTLIQGYRSPSPSRLEGGGGGVGRAPMPHSNKHETFSQCWYNVGPLSSTLAQPNIGWTSRVCWDEHYHYISWFMYNVINYVLIFFIGVTVLPFFSSLTSINTLQIFIYLYRHLTTENSNRQKPKRRNSFFVGGSIGSYKLVVLHIRGLHDRVCFRMYLAVL